MPPSFYMQCTVDKEQKLEAGSWKLEGGSLLIRFARTDNNFGTLAPERVGQDVWNVILIA